MMAAHRTTKMALAVSAALAITLTTACTKDNPKPVQTVAPTPTVTATPTPTYSSRQQEAINSIQKFNDMFNEIKNDRPADLYNQGKHYRQNDMYLVSRGTASEEAIAMIERAYWIPNKRTEGRMVINIRGVEQGVNDRTWIVTTCEDPAAVKVFDASGKDVTPKRDKGSKMVYTTELDTKINKWFVMTQEFKGQIVC